MRIPHGNLGGLKPLSLLDPTSLPSISFIKRLPDSPRPGTYCRHLTLLSDLSTRPSVFRIVRSSSRQLRERVQDKKHTQPQSLDRPVDTGGHLFPRLGSEFPFTRQRYICHCEERVCCVCMHQSAAACATVKTSKFPLPKQVRATH